MNKLSNRRILFLAAAIIVMIMVAVNFPVVLGAVGKLLGVLEPVVMGGCIAFILNLLTNFFEKRVFFALSTPKKSRRRLVRTLSIVCTLVVVFAVIALILLVIVPQVISTMQSIVAAFPAFADRAIEFASKLMKKVGVSPKSITEFVLGGEAFFDKLVNFAEKNLNGLVKYAVSFGSGVISFFGDLLFGFFIAIYFLADKERVMSQCKRLLRAVAGERVYSKTLHIGRIANRSFSNFISGQFIEAIILALLCFFGMLVFDFPYAPVVSVFIGVCALIPIVGAWVGGGVSAVLILTVSPAKALWFLVFYVVLQNVETNFIYPKVVGSQVGLPGIWVLISVVIGTGLFGAVGALVAVPVAAVLYSLASDYVSRSEKKVSVKDDRPLE